MPTQQQIEFYRKRHQQFTPFKLTVASCLGVVTNVALAPLELLKVRGQLVQEGRKLHGYGLERGAPTLRLFYEIVDSGAGLRGVWTGLFLRGVWFGGFRSFFWCTFYSMVNKDPRRQPHWGIQAYSSFLAGFFAGVVTNPIDLVYNRQAADALYPSHLKRNYTSFFDGFKKASAEGALFRGAVASGASYGALLCLMSQFYDYLKEYWYYFFGPPVWLRPTVLLPVSALGTFLYLPFDNLKVRLHTMTKLPNGQFPYAGLKDAFIKAFDYECAVSQHSSILALHTGFIPAFLKVYFTLLTGIYVTDYVFQAHVLEGRLYEPSTFYQGPRLGLIPHDPIPGESFTDVAKEELKHLTYINPDKEHSHRY